MTAIAASSDGGRVSNGLDDVDVAGAAAEVALERVPDLVLARIGVLAEQADGGHHHPGRAVAALEPVLLVERLLHRVQLPVLGEPLDRRHLAPVRLDGEHRARLDRLAVEQDRAGAARRRVAADVRPGQAEALAQDVDEELPRLDLELVPRAVDRDRDLSHDFPPSRLNSPMNCRQIAPSPSRQAADRLRLCRRRPPRPPPASATSCACRQFAKLCDHLLRDVLDDPAPVLRDGSGEHQVGDDVDARPAVELARATDSIVACAAPRPRVSRALAESVALRAASSASSRLTSVSNVSEIGPSFTFSFAFQFESSTVSVERRAGHARDHARDVHQQVPRLLGRDRDLERVLDLHARHRLGAALLRRAHDLDRAGPRPRRRPPAGCASRSEARSARGCA